MLLKGIRTSVIGDSPHRLEDEIRTEIGRLALHHRVVEPVAGGGAGLHQSPVRLHAERIDREDRRLAAVVEGAEQNLDVVVGGDPIAVGQGGVNRPVRLERPDPEVNRGRGVPDQHLGTVRRGNPIGG